MYIRKIVRGITFQSISCGVVSTNKIGKFIFYLWLINLHSCLGKLFLYCSWCCSSVRFSTFLKKSQTSRLGPRYHTFAFALAFVFAFAFAFGLVLGANLFDQCLVFFDNCKGNYISRNLLWCCLYKQDWQVYFCKFLTDKFTFLFGETPPSATLSCVFLLLGLYMEIDLTLACITVVDWLS